MTSGNHHTVPMPTALELSREAGRSLAHTLKSHGFESATLGAFLEIAPNARPAGRTAALEYRCASSGHLGTLVRLFVLSLPVDRERAAAAVHPNELGELEAAGVLVVQGADVQATLEIRAVGPYLFASDRGEWYGHEDFVLQFSASAHLLAAAALFPASGRVLDFGSGCGIHAVMAADGGADVVATDVNPRAAMFTSLNAALNDVSIETRVGNAFESVAGERFDVIVSNLPFIILPDTTRPFLSADQHLDDFCRDFASSAATHLTETGICQFLAGWPAIRNEDPSARVLSWFDGFDGDVLVMEAHRYDPVEYVANYFDDADSDDATSSASFERSLQYYSDLQIEGIVHGLVTMTRCPQPNYLAVTQISDRYDVPFRDDLVRHLRVRKQLSNGDAGFLLQTVVAVGDGVHLVSDTGLTSGVAEEVHVEKRIGIRQRFRIDPTVVALLAGCDGHRTLAEVISSTSDTSASGRGHPADQGELLEIARQCLYDGILDLVDGSTNAP